MLMSLISPDQLLKKIQNKEEIIIVDVRPFSRYIREHIPNSIWFYVWDLTRHEENLPSFLKNEEELAKVLSKNGIDSSIETIIYCDLYSITNASYLYFVLKYLGHKKVEILEGGIEKWIQLNYPVEKGIVQPKKANFEINLNREIKADFEFVKSVLKQNKYIIIDARREEEFKGLETTLPKKGRIPGSVNVPFLEFVEERPYEFNEEKIKSKLERLLEKDKEIIVYCSSGPMATYLYYLLENLYPNLKTKVYLESFLDWINSGGEIEL